MSSSPAPATKAARFYYCLHSSSPFSEHQVPNTVPRFTYMQFVVKSSVTLRGGCCDPLCLQREREDVRGCPSSGSHDKYHGLRGLRSKRLFLTVLVAGKPQIRVPARLLPGGGPCCWLDGRLLSATSHGRGREGGIFGVSSSS